MKPLGRKNYGSIPHLSNSKLGEMDYFIHEGQERILTEKTRDNHDLIIVQEKYDGSNVGVCKKDGKIYALTRAGYEAKTSKYSLHHIFSEWVDGNKDMFIEILNEGERICGEWLLQATGVEYTLAIEPIIFFDLFTPNNERLNHNDFLYRVADYGINTPRIISHGLPISVDDALFVLNLKDQRCYPEEQPEGMIYRCERKGKVDFLAKWVRKDFTTGKYIIGKEENELIYNKRI